MTYTTITACRACRDERLDPVLNLGEMAISDFLEPGQSVDRAPLELVRCAGCGLVQLRHTVDRDRLYQRYWYQSGTNETMIKALEDVVHDAMGRVELKPGDAVLDIGCNDGTLLGQYPLEVEKIGFDPSDVALAGWERRRTVGEVIGRPGAPYRLIRDYFPTTRQHVPVPCKIVTAVAMFYDLDDPGRFLDEVKRWLHPEGVLVLQFQDAHSMVRANAVDNICHEHLCYYSGTTLSRLLQAHKLHAVASSYHDVNGGSLRVTLRHGRSSIEEIGHKSDPSYWSSFVEQAERNKRETVALLERLRDEGKSVYGIAASTKFNTLSQFYGIGPDLITAIGERSPHKVGKFTVTGIPIISEEEMRAATPDYLFCCAWGFADAFMRREEDLLASGTRLIVPLPTLRTVRIVPPSEIQVVAATA